MKRIPLLGVMMLLVVFVAAACSMDNVPLLHSGGFVADADPAVPTAIVAQAPTPTASAAPDQAATVPAFSALASPTPPPTLAGPMGTLTAIADLVASPTQDSEPYTIVTNGVPHFIEFHAWW